MFAVSLHSFIVGQPFRLTRLRRALQHALARSDRIWLTRPKDIASCYKALPKDVQLHAD